MNQDVVERGPPRLCFVVDFGYRALESLRLEKAYPETNRGVGIKLYPLWQTPFNGATSMLPALSVAVVVVLAATGSDRQS